MPTSSSLSAYSQLRHATPVDKAQSKNKPWRRKAARSLDPATAQHVTAARVQAQTKHAYSVCQKKTSKDEAVRNVILRGIGNRVGQLQQPTELTSTSSSPPHPPDKAPKPAQPVQHERAVSTAWYCLLLCTNICFVFLDTQYYSTSCTSASPPKHRTDLFRYSIVQIRIPVKVNSSCGGYQRIASDRVSAESQRLSDSQLHAFMLQHNQGTLRATWLVNSSRLSFNVTRSPRPCRRTFA